MRSRVGIALGAALFSLFATTACKKDSGGSATTQGSPGPGTAPSGATDVKLPSSTTRGTYREDALLVTIGQSGIRLGETRGALIPMPPAAEAGLGVSAEYKGGARATFYLPSLADAIRAHWADGGEENPRASLVVDSAAPFRVLVEVLFTMGRLSVNDLCLVVHKEERRACIDYKMPKSDVPLPSKTAPLNSALLPQVDVAALDAGAKGRASASAAPPRASAAAAPSIAPVERPQLGQLTGQVIALIILKDGYALPGHAGSGCDKLPKIDGRFDNTGLRKCLEKLAPGDAGAITFTLSAPGDTPFQIIVDALDAARETESGAPLMPPVMFAVPS